MQNELNQIMVLLKGLTGRSPGLELFRAMLEYIFAAQDDVSFEEVRNTARNQISTTAEEEAMTIAEQLEKRGHRKGECTVLQRQLENRFGKLSDHYRKLLEQADSDTLLKWSERVLTAQSLEEVFAEE